MYRYYGRSKVLKFSTKFSIYGIRSSGQELDARARRPTAVGGSGCRTARTGMPSYAHVGVHMKGQRRKSSIASIEDWSVSGLARAFAGANGDEAEKQRQRQQNREEDYQDGYKDDDSDVSAEPAWRPGESEVELGGGAWGEDTQLKADSTSSIAKAQAARKREDIRNQLDLIPVLPDKDDETVIKEGRVHCSIENSKKVRKVTLTDRAIYFSAERGGNELADLIPLLEIQLITVNAQKCKCIIDTHAHGTNSGREYSILDPAAYTLWHTEIETAWQAACKKRDDPWRKMKIRSREWYDGTLVQWSVAILIVASFVGVVVEVQYQPVSGSNLHGILGILEIFFTMIFVVDLCFNFYAHYFWLFMKNPWNVLDVVIVFISVLSLIIQASSSSSDYDFLKITRAFRIFRVAGKIKQLKRIVTAIGTSIVPMANGFLIALIFGSIFCVIGTEFFKARDEKNFGTFARTFNTLWLAMAFGMWEVNLPFINVETGSVDMGMLLYTIVFVIFMLWISLQVVLAILLENFVSAQQQEDAREAKYALGKIFEGDQDSGGIDDVLGEMMKFPSSIAMNKGIIRMFCFFDSREIGKIGFREIRHGLKKLKTQKMCLINLEGYKRLMRGIRMVDEVKARMDFQGFEIMMKRAMKTFTQNRLAAVNGMNEDQVETSWQFAALRLLLLESGDSTNRDEKNSAVHLLRRKSFQTFDKQVRPRGKRKVLDSTYDGFVDVEEDMDVMGSPRLPKVENGVGPSGAVNGFKNHKSYHPRTDGNLTGQNGIRRVESVQIGQVEEEEDEEEEGNSGKSKLKGLIDRRHRTVMEALQKVDAKAKGRVLLFQKEVRDDLDTLRGEVTDVREEVTDMRTDVNSMRGELRAMLTQVQAAVAELTKAPRPSLRPSIVGVVSKPDISSPAGNGSPLQFSSVTGGDSNKSSSAPRTLATTPRRIQPVEASMRNKAHVQRASDGAEEATLSSPHAPFNSVGSHKVKQLATSAISSWVPSASPRPTPRQSKPDSFSNKSKIQVMQDWSSGGEGGPSASVPRRGGDKQEYVKAEVGSVPEVAVAKSMAERQASMAQMGLMMYTSSFEAIESDANGSEQEPKKSPGRSVTQDWFSKKAMGGSGRSITSGADSDTNIMLAREGSKEDEGRKPGNLGGSLHLPFRAGPTNL